MKLLVTTIIMGSLLGCSSSSSTEYGVIEPVVDDNLVVQCATINAVEMAVYQYGGISKTLVRVLRNVKGTIDITTNGTLDEIYSLIMDNIAFERLSLHETVQLSDILTKVTNNERRRINRGQIKDEFTVDDILSNMEYVLRMYVQ